MKINFKYVPWIRNKVLLIALVCLCHGCTTTTDLSSQSPYGEWVGKQFVLVQDCYVFKFIDDSRTLYVGRDDFLPKEVAPQFVNKRYHDEVKIVGILPKGTTFTVVRCYEVRDIENSIKNFEASIDGPTDSFRGVIVHVDWLTDITKKPQVFREDLAKPAAQSK